MTTIQQIADVLFSDMTIYRVQGVYASGKYVTHLVGAYNAKHAMESTLNADNRIIRITSAKPSLLN